MPSAHATPEPPYDGSGLSFECLESIDKVLKAASAGTGALGDLHIAPTQDAAAPRPAFAPRRRPAHFNVINYILNWAGTLPSLLCLLPHAARQPNAGAFASDAETRGFPGEIRVLLIDPGGSAPLVRSKSPLTAPATAAIAGAPCTPAGAWGPSRTSRDALDDDSDYSALLLSMEVRGGPAAVKMLAARQGARAKGAGARPAQPPDCHCPRDGVVGMH
jgi:hypothetical protein